MDSNILILYLVSYGAQPILSPNRKDL